MMCENDKLYIPEDIKKMSVSELKAARENLFNQIQRNKKKSDKKEETDCTVTFNF